MKDSEIATEIATDSSEDTIYQRTIGGKRYQLTPEAVEVIETTAAARQQLRERFKFTITYPDGTEQVVK